MVCFSVLSGLFHPTTFFQVFFHELYFPPGHAVLLRGPTISPQRGHIISGLVSLCLRFQCFPQRLQSYLSLSIYPVSRIFTRRIDSFKYSLRSVVVICSTGAPLLFGEFSKEEEKCFLSGFISWFLSGFISVPI